MSEEKKYCEKKYCDVEKVMECSCAIAEAVKLCKPDVISMYPITPQTHIIEHLAELHDSGKLDSELIAVESEHSAISAVLGASCYGARTFTSTAAQGLALMHEILYIVSSMRMPCVMAVANRALSGPINIWCDHSDSMGARDSGWIQLYCESSQEAIDTTIQAYKIAENKNVELPVMVCVDGFSLSHVSEVVKFPYQLKVDKFLPKWNPEIKLDPKKPVTMGPIAYPDSYMNFKKQQADAMENALKVIKEVNSEYSKTILKQNGNGLIETYRTSDAEVLLIGVGSMIGTMRVAVDELRKKGIKAGILKIKCFRPFPKEEIIKAVKNPKKIIVFDRACSLGNMGVLGLEIKSLLNSKKEFKNCIIGLGGRDVRKIDIINVVKSKSSDEIVWVNLNG
ncbi:MAG: transketolase C-terminal domain-containing protein [Candidatus Nanoarchaeia archaeon]|nr:transketolase C-terminal domain-containing protein [Candidatus Nanoarchaeia archaeon]